VPIQIKKTINLVHFEDTLFYKKKTAWEKY
jgi:hypothetical protein